MKYLVVKCIEREIELVAVCDTYEMAFDIMKDDFLIHEQECGVVSEHIETLEQMISDDMYLELDTCGFYKTKPAYAWSNTDEDNVYDIKIIEIE